MENNTSIFETLKQRPPESLTSEELSEAIKQDIRCVGLVPEGMQIEGMSRLSKQEIKDIKAVSDDHEYLRWSLHKMPLERRTDAVCQAAVNADPLNLMDVPENKLSDVYLLHLLRKDGSNLFLVNENRRTPEMYMTAIENCGRSLHSFPKEMITPKIAMKAVQQDGSAIEFVPENVKTPDICRVALSSNCKDYEVIQYVPFPEVCFQAVKSNDDRQEKKHEHRNFRQPEKRRKMNI